MFRLVESLDVFLIYFVELAELIHLLLKFFDSVFEHFDVHSGSLFVFPFPFALAVSCAKLVSHSTWHPPHVPSASCGSFH